MPQRNRIIVAVAAVALAALAIWRRRGDDTPEDTGSWKPV